MRGGEAFAEVLGPGNAASLRAAAGLPDAELTALEAELPRPGALDGDLAERRHHFQTLRCPPRRAAGGVGEDMQKYEDRVAAGGCQSDKGVWGAALEDSHKCVLVVVAELLGFKPGELLLDWGSGCGHAMTWAKMFFDVDGLGLEATPAAARWADRFSAGRHCAIDGRYLEWIPDGLFDYVLSYAALLHLTTEEQCAVALQLVRKLRPAGRAFFGWNRAHRTSPWSWFACFRQASLAGTPKVDVEAVEEWHLFPRDRDEALQSFAWAYPAYAILVKRLA